MLHSVQAWCWAALRRSAVLLSGPEGIGKRGAAEAAAALAGGQAGTAKEKDRGGHRTRRDLPAGIAPDGSRCCFDGFLQAGVVSVEVALSMACGCVGSIHEDSRTAISKADAWQKPVLILIEGLVRGSAANKVQKRYPI